MNSYRTIKEKQLGRKLSSKEVVHHKDGNNYNDKPKNLQACSSQSKHAKIPKKKRNVTEEDIKSLIKFTQKIETISFQKSLKTIFTPYQISIIIRKSQQLYLSKTDSEYYSRIIKKKLIALSDDNLFKIAQQILRN